jgi:hypothetical protein
MRFGRGKLGGSALVRSSANSTSLLSYSRLQSDEIRRRRAFPALQLQSCNTASNDKVGLDSTNAESSPRLPSDKGAPSRGPLLLEALRALAMILARGPSSACMAWKTRRIKLPQRALFLLLLDAIHAMNGRAKEPLALVVAVKSVNPTKVFIQPCQHFLRQFLFLLADVVRSVQAHPSLIRI